MAEKVAIVTAAGRGIGEATARELAARGYRLALMSVSDSGRRLAKEIGGFGIEGSVAEPADLKRLVDETMSRYGRVDAVVNNTGRYSSVLHRFGVELHTPVTPASVAYDPDGEGPLLEVPDEAWHAALDALMLHVVRICRLVTPVMIRQGGGAIVNISGIEAVQPRLMFPVSPARLALHGFTKLYADRYGRHGIRMNSLMPGFLENIDMAPEVVPQIVPLGRLGKTAEMAKAIAFLLSEDAGYITGQNIAADGALNRGI
jgi:NAD(P)-dependent dehydrogenase (short-subunit alcohol dehydrogenase family)